MEPISILICDDHAHFRDGLRALLETNSEVEVVGEAPNGATAVEASLVLQPDVVLMDLTMPGMGWVEATRQLLAACPTSGCWSSAWSPTTTRCSRRCRRARAATCSRAPERPKSCGRCGR